MKDKLNILFGTDFGDSAKLALQTIIALQKNYTVDVTLMHTITSFWKNWLSSGVYEKEELQRLRNWQHKIAPKGDDAHLIVCEGNAATAVVTKAKDIKADLIVLGGGDHQGERRYLTGSTASMVARVADRSVWVCKSNTITNVLCGVDCSEPSSVALRHAIDICKRFKAKLTVICALPSIDFNPLGLTKAEIKAKEAEFEAQKSKNFKKFLNHFDLKGLDVHSQTPWGLPSATILDMAADFDHDLIVIGASGESKLYNAMLGSTAEKILRAAPCSLLVVR